MITDASNYQYAFEMDGNREIEREKKRERGREFQKKQLRKGKRERGHWKVGLIEEVK